MTYVILDGRKFIVDFDESGAPVRIKERKLHYPGHPWLEGWINIPYWSAKHHKLGGSTTLPVRIIAEATKQNAR